jgi:hypothetical protein
MSDSMKIDEHMASLMVKKYLNHFKVKKIIEKESKNPLAC